MSGIYIPGMEMPKTCCYCPLMGYDPDRDWFDSMARTGAHICVLTGELIDNTKREGHCPLILIPDHGRLIDADALITKVTDAAIKQPEIADVYYEQASEIGGWLYSMPTIIPADVTDMNVGNKPRGVEDAAPYADGEEDENGETV